IYRVTATWAEMTVTWTNQPAHNSTAYATTLVQGGKWYAWDVKTLIQDWVNATYSNYGFKLIRRNEAGGAWPYFVSSDYPTGTNRPKLTVDYTPTAIAPASVGKVKALFK
ncbi:MAG: DNRLRE domain-containing protein, partial [bacterium]